MQRMSTAKTLQIESTSLEDTYRFAEIIGKNLKGHECLELVSDLGGGKTTFVRGLVKGTGSLDRVSSPTFTLMKEYKADHFDIHHYDLYRLQNGGVVGEELRESLLEPRVVTVVEWADIASGSLPEERVIVTITIGSGDNRIYNFNYPESLSYLFKSI